MERQNILTGIKLLSSNNSTSKQSRKESVKENQELLSIKENSVIIKNNHNYKLFKFDCCLGKYENQNYLYDNFCLTTAQDFVDGYDSTLILCGNFSSSACYNDILLGKDTEENKGLLPRLIDHMTNSINYLSERKFLFKVSFLEINNEEMIDLLGVKKCKLQMKPEKSHKNSYYVNNLEIKTLQKIDQIESFYLVGNRKRQYAYSKQLRKRQNSTAFFTIYLESLQGDHTIYRHSRYVFCELACSSFQKFKTPSTDKLFHQTMNSIRLSEIERQDSFDLSNYSFQNVINTIVYGQESTVVPFNDSKVTKLLSQALGGNMKTTILGLIEAQCLSELDKTLRILKTLQVASQIENTPSNLKENSSANRGLSIVQSLKQIHTLSNQLEKLKVELQILINNSQFVSNEVSKLKHQNDPLITTQNQFCSQQHIEDHFLQEKTKKEWELKKQIKSREKILKQKISFIQNYHGSKYQQKQNESKKSFLNEEKIISKRKQILLRIKAVKQKRLNSIPNSQIEQLERQRKRQTFALEIQFQKQRNQFTSNIRQLQEKLSFYKQIAQSYLKKEEILMIKSNSKFDETRRLFELPMFMVRDRKLRGYNNNNGPESYSSQRKFIVSPRAKSFNSYYSSKSLRNSGKGLSFNKKMENILARKHKASDEYRLEEGIRSSGKVISQKESSKNIRGINNLNTTSNKEREKTLQQIGEDKLIRLRSPQMSSQRRQVKNGKGVDFQKKKELSEYAKKVKGQYELGPIDMGKVMKYNQQRQMKKQKQRQMKNKSPSLSSKSPSLSLSQSPFFMKNKGKLLTSYTQQMQIKENNTDKGQPSSRPQDRNKQI